MKYLLISLLLTQSLLALAGEKVDKRTAFSDGGEIVIDVEKGYIKVKAWDKAEIHVVGDIDGSIDNVLFEVTDNNALLKIGVDKGFFGGRHGVEANLVVHVPETSIIKALGVSADFRIEGIKQYVEAHTVSGDLSLDNISGDFEVDTVSGDIDVENCDGKMKLVTVSGDIKTKGQAKNYYATSVSGDIEATIGKTNWLDLTSISGDLDIQFQLAEEGRIEAETVSGDVQLNFDGSTLNARFDIETGPSGEIRNKLSNHQSARKVSHGFNEIQFRLGNGNGSVEIDTLSGTVVLDN
jgi:DUF4097 and DUF4098 domain-containing protein YvlB